MIVFILILLLMFWLWPSIWFMFVQNRLQVSIRVCRRVVEIGETFELECEVVNHGRMPCPMMEILVSLPEGLRAAGDREERLLRLQTHLAGRQSVVVRGQVQSIERGIQTFRKHPVQIVLNEGFGIRSLAISRDVDDEVVVLPAFADIDQSALPMHEISGRLEQFRWLFPDESLLRGIRPYERGDALKHIAWAATAATGNWQVKQYSSSTDADVMLVVNAQFHEQHWYGTVRHQFDEMAARAATLAYWLHAQGFTLSLASNAIVTASPTQICHGRQTAPGIRVLLGTMQPYANHDFTDVWRQVAKRIPANGRVIVFTGFLTEAHRRLLQHGPVRKDQITLIEVNAS